MIQDNLKQPREYMEMVYSEMLKSVHDNERDKTSPYVAALIVLPDGSYEIAHRCHTRDGHRAEESVLDDLNPGVILDGAEIYVTLEPCVQSARGTDKIACSVRIHNARIKKVYVGMRDPNPKVYNQGIQYLLDHGIAVQMFDDDIREKIEFANRGFSKQFGSLDTLQYRKIENAILPSLSEEAINYFCQNAGIDTSHGYGNFWDWLLKYQILVKEGAGYVLIRDGLLAFAKDTIGVCDAAVMQLLVRFSPNTIFNTTGKWIEYREDYAGPEILVMEKILAWAEKYIVKEQDRSAKNTEMRYVVPLSLLKESMVNAVVHRDYTDDVGAFTQIFISDEYLSVSNPTTLKNTTLENLNAFRSKSNPINPKLARLFQGAHLMERSSSGMQTFSSAVPKPVYEYTDGILSIQFGYSRQNTLHILQRMYGDDVTQKDFELYEFIRDTETVTRRNVEERFGVAPSTANLWLNRLVNLKMIERVGAVRSKNAYYRTL